MNLGMNYSAIAPSTAQTAAFDIFEIVAPSDCVVVLTGLYIGQSTDYGDAQAEGLKIQGVRAYSTSGSGGSSVTPVKKQTGFAAAGSTVEANNTTQATGGSPLTEFEDNFNVQIGYQWRPTPEEYIILSPSERFVWKISAPADSTTFGATMTFAEVGG